MSMPVSLEAQGGTYIAFNSTFRADGGSKRLTDMWKGKSFHFFMLFKHFLADLNRNINRINDDFCFSTKSAGLFPLRRFRLSPREGTLQRKC